MSLDGGTYTLNAGASGTGAGTFRVNGGTLNAAAGATPTLANLTLASGTVSGPGSLTIDQLTWTGGTLGGSVTTTGVSSISGANTKSLATATLTNAGTIAWSGGTIVSGNGGSSTIANLAGATFDSQADTTITPNGGGAIALNNAGTLRKSAGTGTTTLNVALNNTGTVDVQAGTLSLQGTFSNFTATTNTLTGGSYIVAGRLQFNNANIVTNAAAITLVGAGSQVVDASNVNAFRGFVANATVGSFTLQGGRSLTTPGGFANSGSLTVGAGSTFTATGAYTQGAGSTNLVGGGVLTSTTSSVAINGGLLGGSGAVNGNVGVANAAQVAPGGVGSTGILTVAGSYTQGTGATLAVELGGPNAGTGYDQLNVTGQANLGGTLSLALINGFSLSDKTTFQVVNYNPRSGQFATVIPPANLPAGTSLTANYLAGNLTLSAAVVPVLTSVAVTPSNPNLAKGLTQQFTAIGTYNDGSTANLTNLVTWASANPGVATISNAAGSQGLAAALAEGTTTITATLGGFSGSTTLTVSAAVLQAIAVTPTGSSIAKGLTQQFAATGTYSDSTTRDLTNQVAWASSNTAVATITSTGLATGAGVGATQIGATLGGVTGTTTLTVTAAALTGISVTPANATIVSGLTRQFFATGSYTDGTTADLTGQVGWASSNTAVASINANGLATGGNLGSTTITATLNGFSGSTTLTVSAAVLQSLAVTPAGPSIAKGLTQQFFATGSYSDGTTRDLTGQVTWTVTDTAVATINANGLAFGAGVGATLVRATLGSATAETTLTVTAAALTGIAVTPANSAIASGQARQFAAIGTYTDGTAANLTGQVTWASATPGVATVDATGLATAINPGSTVITATLGSVVGSTGLTVTSASLVSIAVTPANSSVAKGLTQQFVATGTYSDSTTANLTGQVTWASANTAVATISPTGLATALAQGTTQITATLGDVATTASLTVTPAALTFITISPTAPSVTVGAAQAFAATGFYTDGTSASLTAQVTWASSSSAVATISNAAGSQGVATGIAAGTTTITATLGSNFTASTALTVAATVPATVGSVGVAWGSVGSAPLVTAGDGLRLLPAGRTTSIPWLGINRISLTLSKAAALSAGDVTVAGANLASYGPVTVSGSGTSYVITLARAIDDADRVTITVGNAAIASFTRRLDVLPGDVNDNGVVDATDATLVRNAYLAGVVNLTADLDGDGVVTLADYNLARRKAGTRLPTLG